MDGERRQGTTTRKRKEDAKAGRCERVKAGGRPASGVGGDGWRPEPDEAPLLSGPPKATHAPDG